MRSIVSAALAFTVLAFAVLACGRSPTAVTEPAVADVTGRVLTASGAPLVATTVTIVCAGAAGAIVTTDTAGVYGTSLTAPTAASGTRVACRFSVGTAAAPRIRADTTVGFGTWGLPHPIQLVNLREAQ